MITYRDFEVTRSERKKTPFNNKANKKKSAHEMENQNTPYPAGEHT
jgi:hypothetical protein